MNASEHFSRRSLLAATAGACLGVRAAPAVALPKGSSHSSSTHRTADRVIYLFMDGGMSQIDTFDPKPGTDAQGPLDIAQTNVAGIQFSQHFPGLATQADKLAIVRSVSTTQGAHVAARYFAHTSYRQDGGLTHPAMGAWARRFAGTQDRILPGNVIINPPSDFPNGGFLGQEFSALPISDPERGLANVNKLPGTGTERWSKQLELTNALSTEFRKRFPTKAVQGYTSMYDEAIRLMHSDDVKAFDVSLESDATRDRFGRTPFGQGCLLARRLVETGVRFVEVVKFGWDTHIRNFEALDELAPDLDQALTALLTDLSDRGLLDSTMVVLATEFGRTPTITMPHSGRGHHVSAFTSLLAGGGIQGGQVYGATDESSSEVVDTPVSIPDLNATIAFAMGLPLAEETRLHDRPNPLTLADDGAPIKELF